MICFTESELAQAQAFIDANDIIAYDTETTGLNTRKDIVIGFSFGNETEAYYVPLAIWQNNSLNKRTLNYLQRESFLRILSSLSRKKLVMWNAAFDVLISKQSLGVDLLPALHADALLMKHTCDEEYPFRLKEVATKLWGHDVTKEKEAMQASIKANGGKAKEYYKADVSVLGEYACQDAMLTMRLFNYYNNQLSEQGLAEFYYNDEVLPLYKLVTIPMVERGVRVDLPLLYSSQIEIKSDLEQLEARIQETIGSQLDLFTTWFLNKDYPTKTATGLMPKWAKDGLTQSEAWQRDCPGEYMFNLNSKYHLKKLLFDTLKVAPLSWTKPSKRFPKGQPQVDDNLISSLHKTLPWTVALSDYNSLNKLKGTYIDKLIEENEEGRFYPQWLQHGTISGRFSGDMQQLPRPLDSGSASPVVEKHTNRIRQFIIADEGSQLCSADYEQLEPTIFAHCSGDAKLQAVFNSGADFYSTVAIDTEGLQGVSADKRADNYLGRVSKAARQKASRDR
jgi:DNA polymerase-1